MKHSEVLIKILTRAKEIRDYTASQSLSAYSILASVAEFCGTGYRGITFYFSEHYPVCYEEERLRYLYEKLFQASGNLVSFSLIRRMRKDTATYDTEFFQTHLEPLEALATARRTKLLTADVVFLLALDSITDRRRLGLRPEYQEKIPATELLDETDRCIFDYVIDEIEKIQVKLQKKADEVRAKRDWKPAAKFTEPELLRAQFLNSVQVSKSDRYLELVFPWFYDGQRELRLKFIRVDGVYYVTDNHGVTGCFCQVSTFMRYLQDLMLLDKQASTGYTPKADPVDVDRSTAEVFDWDILLEELNQCILARYEEQDGLILSIVGLHYPDQDVSASFLLETRNDGSVRIRDYGKHFGRDENLESFSLTENLLDGFCIPLLFRFIHRAVVITTLGRPETGL